MAPSGQSAAGKLSADDAPVFGVARGNGLFVSGDAGSGSNGTKRRRDVSPMSGNGSQSCSSDSDRAGYGGNGNKPPCDVHNDDDDVVVLDDVKQDPARVLEAVVPRIEQHAACPICTGTLYKPVMHTACGNSFCEACALQLQQNAVNLSTAECSVCRRREGRFVPNVALRNVLETLAQKVPALRRNMLERVRMDQIAKLGKFSD
tara:strand:- start:7199 stop:7810 length:612 start_codon:yes stop_codon:yes gene_type:complete